MTDPAIPPCLHRRAVLSGAAALAGLLAGCSTAPPTPSAQTSTPAGQAGPAEQSSRTEQSPATAPSPTEGSSAQPADGSGVALAAVKEIAVGSGAVVSTTAGPVLLVRIAEKRVAAYKAACPHAGVTVNAPVGDTVRCPGHNSRFAASDGSRISGPAKTGLTLLPTKVTDGQVYLA